MTDPSWIHSPPLVDIDTGPDPFAKLGQGHSDPETFTIGVIVDAMSAAGSDDARRRVAEWVYYRWAQTPELL